MIVGRIIYLSLMLASAGCAAAKEPPVRIFAAASTREAVEQIAQTFQSQTGLAVETNYGASSSLARQIERGADADLFLSADENWADFPSRSHMGTAAGGPVVTGNIDHPNVSGPLGRFA